MSRFDTMASISSALSVGTITSSDCAGVTTPPTVCTASCCTTPSTGDSQLLQPRPLLCLDQILREAIGLLLALGEIVERGLCRYSAIGWSAGLADCGDCRFGLVQMALLDLKLLLLFDEELLHLVVGQLRADLLLHQRFADVDTLLR